MKPRIVAVNVLAVWGALCAAAILALAALLAYDQIPKHDRATKSDVRFMLNWPELSEDRLDAVLHSHTSNSALGDHFDAFAIRLNRLTEADLMAPKRNEPSGWIRGDQADAVLREAVAFVGLAHDDAPWLPNTEQILRSDCYLWVWRIELRRNNHVTGADLIIARPSDRTMFYASLEI